MPSRLQYAVLLMAVGALLIVGPILHGPVTTDLSYEYEVEEVPSDELPRSVAHQAPNVRECFTDFEARDCTLEHMVDAEDLVMDVDEFEEDIDAGTRESDTIYMLGDGMVRPVATHDGNGTVTLTHEPVTEEEFIEESVVSEGRIDSDDAAVESIELGQTVTDEPIEVWEAYRIVEYEGSYYQTVDQSYQQPTETTYMKMTRFLTVVLGFWMLLYGRKVQVREMSN